MFYCEFCDFKTDKKYNNDRHLKTRLHLKKKEEYEKALDFLNNSKYEITEITDHIMIPIIENKSEVMKKIYALVELYKNDNINLNNYFRYNYYAQNFNDLNNLDLHDFLGELEDLIYLLKEPDTIT